MDADAIGLQKNNFVIVINSCDKYSDLWSHFDFFFHKYWPNCAIPIYWFSNFKINENKRYNSILSRQNTTWSKELAACLVQVPCKNILYLQEDYFLKEKVSIDEIDRSLELFIKQNADYFRLYASPPAKNSNINNLDIGLLSTNELYATSLQCSFWKIDTFLSLLNPLENAWEFEINSPSRSGQLKLLAYSSVQHSAIVYDATTAVYKGRWIKKVYNRCLENGLIVDINYRKVENFAQNLYRRNYPNAPLFIKHIWDFWNNFFAKISFNKPTL